MVLIAAHGSSLRAIVKHLDQISDEAVVRLNIPIGIPLHYEPDDDVKPTTAGSYLDPEAAAIAVEASRITVGSSREVDLRTVTLRQRVAKGSGSRTARGRDGVQNDPSPPQTGWGCVNAPHLYRTAERLPGNHDHMRARPQASLSA